MPKKNDKWLTRYRQWRGTTHGQEVFCQIGSVTLDMIRRGFDHYSMQMIVYVVRYHRHLKTGRDEEGWKVNNNFTSYLARDIMKSDDRIPDGFFELRV